jgi:predicted RND superfamily exporter protein
VAQTLITFQNSHRPQDLWHFVTPDYRKTNLWLQLKSGDNVDMTALTDAVARFFQEEPPPVPLNHDWFGLTYINVVWQKKMVTGMMKAFLGSFIIVLLMMAFLFRSFWWGLFSMVPLTVTIATIYGLIGFIGKDYDMPVAILSSLSLGLAVDYAIHFMARSRALRKEHPSWKETAAAVFGDPARSITRNVIVIGVGFMPLLAAPLVPYKTVGVFISAILLLAGAATLIILPAMLTVFEKFLFKTDLLPEEEG